MTRTERIYYLVVALWSLPGWFMHPVYPMFLQSRGLDLFQVNSMLAIFQICVFLFEMPTGAVADRYGRKLSFLASCATRAFAFLLYTRADSYLDCAIAEIIDALGLTMASGALEAWAVDGIRAEGDHRPLDRVFARAQTLSRATVIAGGVTCGLIADRFGLVAPWYVAAGGFALAGLVGQLCMYDDRRPRGSKSSTPAHGAGVAENAGEGFRASIARAWNAVRQHRLLRTLCGLTVLFAFTLMPVVLQWPSRLHDLAGEGFWLLGSSWALLNLAAVCGAGLVSPLLRRLRREQLLILVTVWRACFLAMAAFAPSGPWLVMSLCIYELGVAAYDPVMNAWMNEHIESSLRATVLYVNGMAFTLGGSMGLLSLGWFARNSGIPTAWLICVVILLLAAPLHFKLLSRTSMVFSSSKP